MNDYKVFMPKRTKRRRENEQLSVFTLSYIFHSKLLHIFVFLIFFFRGMDCSKHSSKRQTGVNFNYFIHMYAVLLYTQLLLPLLLSLIYHLVETEGMRHEMPTAQHKYKLHYTYSRLLYKKIWKKYIKQLLNKNLKKLFEE